MHEHGLMKKLIGLAQAEALEKKGELRSIRIRLGALADADPDHFRGDFEHVREEMGLAPITLEIELAPERPSGVELIGIEVSA